jgi:hypothetical protein
MGRGGAGGGLSTAEVSQAVVMSRALKTVRYASRTTGVNFEKILTWGAIGAGLYLAFKVLGLVNSSKDALAAAGGAIGSGLYDLFHRDPLGETTFYVVTFPDGANHSIPSRSIDNAGLFKNSGNGVNYFGDGKTYRIMIRKSDGRRVAVLA